MGCGIGNTMKKVKIVLIIVFDIFFAYFFLTVRSLPRLLIWNIQEVRNKQFFYPAENRFAYAAFEKDTSEITTLARDLDGVIDISAGSMQKIVALLGFVHDNYVKNYAPRGGKLRWGPPLSLIAQHKAGAKGFNCFHYAIIFNSYAAGAGIKTRLWVLEGDDYLERFGHSVVEAYIPEYAKWIVLDPSSGSYFLKEGVPLSLLELRDCLLYQGCVPSVAGKPRNVSNADIVALYSRLLETVLLRSASDFSNKLTDNRLRWGVLSFCGSFLEALPYYAQRAIELGFGRKDYFFHYADKNSKSLYPYAMFVRLLFWGVIMVNLLIAGRLIAEKLLRMQIPSKRKAA